MPASKADKIEEKMEETPTHLNCLISLRVAISTAVPSAGRRANQLGSTRQQKFSHIILQKQCLFAKYQIE